MAADYQAIVDAIDTAIENWVEKPVSISVSDFSITYRSLRELIEARRHYAKLAITKKTGRGFTITNLKAGNAG